MVKCPICKADFSDLSYRPFCSKRCADIDLGNWFGEKYAVEATELDESQQQELIELLDDESKSAQHNDF